MITLLQPNLPHNVSEPNTQVIADTAIDTNLIISSSVIRQNDTDCFTSTFAFQQHCIATEQLQFIHLGLPVIHKSTSNTCTRAVQSVKIFLVELCFSKVPGMPK